MKQSINYQKKLIPSLIIGVLISSIAFVLLTYPGGMKGFVKDMRSIEPTFVNAILACVILSIAIVCCIPSSPLEMAFGLVFGWYGTLISTIGITIGSCISFLIGRTPLFTGFSAKLQENETVKLFSIVLQKDLYQYLILSRIAQVPIFLKNYGFAVIPQVPFWSFSIIVLLVSACLCPVWTYVGIMTQSMGDDDENNYEPTSVKVLRIGSAVLGVAALLLIGGRAWKGIKIEGERQRQANAAAAANNNSSDSIGRIRNANEEIDANVANASTTSIIDPLLVGDRRRSGQ